MVEYGFDSSPITSYVQDKARLCSPSDFALANYSCLSTMSSYTTPARQNGGTVQYWTSSAGSTSSGACNAGYRGSVSGSYVKLEFYAARPALLFNLAG